MLSASTTPARARRLNPISLPAVQRGKCEAGGEVRKKAAGFSKSIAAMTTLMCLRSIFLTVSALRSARANHAVSEESLAAEGNFLGDAQGLWSGMHIGDGLHADFGSALDFQDRYCSSSDQPHDLRTESDTHGAGKDAWCMSADMDDVVSAA